MKNIPRFLVLLIGIAIGVVIGQSFVYITPGSMHKPKTDTYKWSLPKTSNVELLVSGFSIMSVYINRGEII